jgi:hypothetical protein
MSDNTFQENGFKVIKGLIDPSDFFSHLQKLEEQGKGHIDFQVPGARVFYKDARFEKLLQDLIPTMEKHAGCRLFKTYSFARQYEKGTVLKSHRDRNACEISVTISLGHKEKSWPIWLLDKDERPHSIVLDPGDALMFKGIEHAHWREKNIYGPCSQVFLHYVDQDGPYAIHKDDRRKGNWFTVPMFKRDFKFSIMPSYEKDKSKGMA